MAHERKTLAGQGKALAGQGKALAQFTSDPNPPASSQMPPLHPAPAPLGPHPVEGEGIQGAVSVKHDEGSQGTEALRHCCGRKPGRGADFKNINGDFKNTGMHEKGCYGHQGTAGVRA